VAKRYAAALFNTALDKKALDRTARDMALIREACAASPAFTAFVQNPVIPLSKKEAVVREVFGRRTGPLTLSFINFLCHKNRLEVLDGVSDIFLKMEKDHQGIVEAEFISARPARAETVKKIEKDLSEKYRKIFTLQTRQSADLLGGFKLHIRDRIFDCSIKNQLERLKKTLAGGPQS
jgi:F-type H+-transporting ATPase subunit delta